MYKRLVALALALVLGILGTACGEDDEEEEEDFTYRPAVTVTVG